MDKMREIEAKKPGILGEVQTEQFCFVMQVSGFSVTRGFSGIRYSVVHGD